MAPFSVLEEEAMPEKFNLGIWKKIFIYVFRHPFFFTLSLLSTIFVSFYDSSFVPVMNAGAIAAGEIITPGSITSINEVVIPVTFIFGIHIDFNFAGYVTTLGVMILLRSALIVLSFYMTNMICLHVVAELRHDCFIKIQGLSFSYFDKNSSGWLIARMQNDTSSIGDVLSWAFNGILWSIFEVIFTIVTMFSVNWVYALVVLASLPFIIIITPIFEKLLLKLHRSARNAHSMYVGYLSESISGAKTIKSLSIETQREKEAKEIIEEVRRRRLKAIKVDAIYSPLLSLLSSAMIALVVFLGAVKTEWHSFAIDAATLILFVTFVSSIYDPLISVVEIFGEFVAAQAGAEKVIQLLEAEEEIVDTPEVVEKYGTVLSPKPEAYEDIQGDIVFKDVSFSYLPGQEIIHTLNLHIEKGKSLAIVGETGSGKTTIANLLCRFYEPTSGKVEIDGVEYRKRSLGWLRSHIGYVQQTPFLFNVSIKENIAYGRKDASMEEIIAAAKLVGMHDFIMRQKDGYDTLIKDEGGSLSQGQKQLISFARAIVRNPSILILDEATSSIDTKTEGEVQAALSKLLKGRTSIIIAHRLSTISGADRILVLDKGVIVEDGNHKTLMEQKGRYYSLYMNQFKELSLDAQIKTYDSQIEGKGIKLGK